MVNNHTCPKCGSFFCREKYKGAKIRMKKNIKEIEEAIDEELTRLEAKTNDKKLLKATKNIRTALDI